MSKGYIQHKLSGDALAAAQALHASAVATHEKVEAIKQRAQAEIEAAKAALKTEHLKLWTRVVSPLGIDAETSMSDGRHVIDSRYAEFGDIFLIIQDEEEDPLRALFNPSDEDISSGVMN